MRLAFMGTPDFAVTALEALVAAGHDVAAVYTQPPRRANRGRLTASAVEDKARGLGLDVRTPLSLRDADVQAEFAALDLDLAVVAAYGLILPQEILDAPRRGCLNIHASLLPRWRGAAPVQRAILAGDKETGVTIMQMERGLDTGPILARRAIAIARQTASTLTTELAELGAQLLLDVIARPDQFPPVVQPEDGVTYASKITKAEAEIDWAAPAIHIDRLVRAMQTSPGAWFASASQRVKLIEAEPAAGHGEVGQLIAADIVAAGEGALRLICVQPAGKRTMPAGDWLRGRHITIGDSIL